MIPPPAEADFKLRLSNPHAGWALKSLNIFDPLFPPQQKQPDEETYLSVGLQETPTNKGSDQLCGFHTAEYNTALKRDTVPLGAARVEACKQQGSKVQRVRNDSTSL